MCGHDGVTERTAEYTTALAGAVGQWNALEDPWTARGADRRALRHAVMAARMEGACWGDIGSAVGAEKDDLKALFGCMPRYGRRSEHGEGGCGGGHGHGRGHGHAGEDSRTHRVELLPTRP